MRSLVGYTGFVGSNLNLNGEFQGLYNSKNIGEAFGTCPDILVYSGVPRQKFIANKYPERDFEIVKNAFENIKKINPIVLIAKLANICTIQELCIVSFFSFKYNNS